MIDRNLYTGLVRLMKRLRPGVMILLSTAALSAVSMDARAQSGGPAAGARVFTLEEALQHAVDHYPTVRAALEQTNASAAHVTVARSASLPRLDALWQTNRATANNIFGQVLPQSAIPAMSGPVLTSASAGSVWGSAAGALLSWEPFDLGLRSATVREAEALVGRARADEALTRLDVQSAVAGAFLAVVTAQQAVSAADADVQRRDVLARAARTLADNQLRPGAEASRAEAERAAAYTRAIQARQILALTQATLGRVLGVTTGLVTTDAARLLDRAPTEAPLGPAVHAHPLAQVRQAAVDIARAREDVLARTDRPRLYLQSSAFARGSGANPDGHLDGGVGGLGLERGNWATGVQVVFPNLFDFTSLRARQAASAALTRAESARHEEALLTVTSQQQSANILLDAARAIALNTPIQLAAAQQSEAQARARYEAGLASIVEVAETQGLLAQAEYQNAVARVDVWRGLLARAVAYGNVPSFIGLVRAGAP